MLINIWVLVSFMMDIRLANKLIQRVILVNNGFQTKKLFARKAIKLLIKRSAYPYHRTLSDL